MMIMLMLIDIQSIRDSVLEPPILYDLCVGNPSTIRRNLHDCEISNFAKIRFQLYYLHVTPLCIEWPVGCWLLWWVAPVRSSWWTMPVMDKRDFLPCNLPHCAQNKHQLHHHCQLEQQERTGRNKSVLVSAVHLVSTSLVSGVGTSSSCWSKGEKKLWLHSWTQQTRACMTATLCRMRCPCSAGEHLYCVDSL